VPVAAAAATAVAVTRRLRLVMPWCAVLFPYALMPYALSLRLLTLLSWM
jgi:hypothetical protein